MNDIVILLILFAVAVLAAYAVFRGRRRQDPRPDAAIMTVTADARAFTVTDSRKIKSLDVRWQDVKEVRIIRTDKGPFDDQLFYHVVYEGGEITLPSRANNMQAFSDQLAALPRFDKKAHDAAVHGSANDTYSRIFMA